jgi:hypothetical protein
VFFLHWLCNDAIRLFLSVPPMCSTNFFTNDDSLSLYSKRQSSNEEVCWCDLRTWASNRLTDELVLWETSKRWSLLQLGADHQLQYVTHRLWLYLLCHDVSSSTEKSYRTAVGVFGIPSDALLIGVANYPSPSLSSYLVDFSRLALSKSYPSRYRIHLLIR